MEPSLPPLEAPWISELSYSCSDEEWGLGLGVGVGVVVGVGVSVVLHRQNCLQLGAVDGTAERVDTQLGKGGSRTLNLEPRYVSTPPHPHPALPAHSRRTR